MQFNPLAWIYKLKDPLYRNSLFLLGSTAATAALGFFYWLIVARIYSAGDVGYGSAAISAMTLLGSLGLVGVNHTIIRYLPSFQKPIRLINTSLTLTILLSIFVALIFVLGIDIFSPALGFIKDNIIFAAAFTVFIVGFCLTSVLDSIFIAGRNSQFVLFMDTSISFFKIPLAVILALSFHSFGIAASWGLATTVVVIVVIFAFLPKVIKGYKPVPDLSSNVILKIWKYSSTNYIATILNNLPAWILPIIVVNILGSEQNAYFYSAWLIYSLLIAINLACTHSMFAEASNNPGKLWSISRRTMRFTYILLIPAAVIVIALSTQILWLFGEDYSAGGSSLLAIMAASSLLSTAIMSYNVVLRIESRMKELCILSAVHSILIIVPCLLFTKSVGIVSIGYILFLANLVTFGYAAISFYRVKKRYG
jgi:O-antigen/teichoic acid export membrane protein